MAPKDLDAVSVCTNREYTPIMHTETIRYLPGRPAGEGGLEEQRRG